MSRVLCTPIDVFLVLALMCVVVLAATSVTRVDVVAATLSGVEGMLWSAFGWVGSAETKTQTVVRTGMVGSLMGWMFKPGLFLLKRWVRRSDAHNS